MMTVRKGRNSDGLNKVEVQRAKRVLEFGISAISEKRTLWAALQRFSSSVHLLGACKKEMRGNSSWGHHGGNNIPNEEDKHNTERKEEESVGKRKMKGNEEG